VSHEVRESLGSWASPEFSFRYPERGLNRLEYSGDAPCAAGALSGARAVIALAEGTDGFRKVTGEEDKSRVGFWRSPSADSRSTERGSRYRAARRSGTHLSSHMVVSSVG